MSSYFDRYTYLIGFFLGYLDIFESNQDIFKLFSKNPDEIPICIDEISKLINDDLLDWKIFTDEANIYFQSKTDFINFLIGSKLN
ncbi:hypothetical protein NCW36_13605 [Acinetobacter pittii]|nr:hypothetical protein [Acinetobacter pittii]